MRPITTVPTVTLALALLAHGLQAQATPEESSEWNLPQWAAPTLHNAPALRELKIFYKLNPYYLQGDFDGDGQLDLAVQVENPTTHKRGVAIIHHRDLSICVLGAGHSFGNGGDDFSWLWQWSVDEKAVLRSPKARGHQVLYVGKGDSAGGMIWWDGHQYVWTQWGD
jgi:hypothetical protein